MHGQSVCGVQWIAVRNGDSEMQSQFMWKGIFKLPVAILANSEYLLTVNFQRQAVNQLLS